VIKKRCIRCKGHGVIEEENIDGETVTQCPRCKGTGIEEAGD